MTYLVYLTDECKRDAQKAGLSLELSKLRDKVEKDQSIANWDHFLPSPYVKKSLGSGHRLVAALMLGGGYVVISLLHVFNRSDSQYKNFLNDPQNSGLLLPSEKALKAFISSVPAYTYHPLHPSALESEYLHVSGEHYLDQTEGIIYESWDWAELSIHRDFTEMITWYYEALLDLIGASDDEKASRTVWKTPHVQIMYRYFRETKRLLLIAPTAGMEETKQNELTQKYRRYIDAPESMIAEEAILRISSRSYPAMIFYETDARAWRDIENNREGNLALSPEEFKLLETVLHPSTEDRVFPLFINGGPGSGKSTILQYLFAEYIYHYLQKPSKQRLPFPPLYLTYSGALLDAAKRSVQTILLCNSEKQIRGKHIDKTELGLLLEGCFVELHHLLLKCVPASAKLRFPSSGRVDFRVFRRLFDSDMKKNPDAKIRKLSPELAWHVIRTYIKGMREESGAEFDTNAYEELPLKQRSVDPDTFQTIFTHVWQKWYRRLCAEQGRWDDQDLARYVLDSNSELSLYPVVFCDEAQDFTKIELELLLRLSLYPKRVLSPQELQRIPFGFAGDPFQTLNPTGFNWSSVQAGFHEKIVQALDPLGRSQLKFNYQPLAFNYRSTRNIVGFCNVIQLIRGVLFDKKDLRCQKSWFGEEAAVPVWFDIYDTTSHRNLRAETELIIILPCQEGEENDYVAEDADLKEIARGGTRNFFSPMRAKGLEFSRVVLYKFGEEYLKKYPDLLKPLTTGIPHSQKPEVALPFEYFMNRLYVGASRAKKRLIIVDTQRAIKEFWQHECFQNLTRLLEQYPTASRDRYGWNIDDLTLIQRGQEESWTKDRDDPAQLAQLLFEDGRAQQDPYKLDKAEALFRRLGMEGQVRESRALKFEYNNSYKKAGEEYVLLGRNKDALRCFWQAEAYARICEIAEFENTLKRRAAEFMVSEKNLNACAGILEYLSDESKGLDREKLITDPQIAKICDEAIDHLATTDNKIPTTEWNKVYRSVSALVDSGVVFGSMLQIGELAFRAAYFKDAVEIWKKLDPATRPTRFQDAQAELQIKTWEEFGDKTRETSDAIATADAYMRRNRIEEALQLLYLHPVEEAVERAVRLVNNDSDRALAAAALIRVRSQDKEWSDALHYVTRKTARSEDAALLANVFIFELARAEDGFLKVPKPEIEKVRNYLRRTFLETRWNNSFSLRVTGTALEKADTIENCIAFYERIWASEGSQISVEDKELARKRWLKCRDRYALRLDEQRKTELSTDYFKQTEERARRWGVKLLDIPEYMGVSEADLPEIVRKSAKEQPSPVVTEVQRAIIKASAAAGVKISDLASQFGLAVNEIELILANSTD